MLKLSGEFLHQDARLTVSGSAQPFCGNVFGDWIGAAIDAPLKHLGRFLEGKRLAHGQIC